MAGAADSISRRQLEQWVAAVAAAGVAAVGATDAEAAAVGAMDAESTDAGFASAGHAEKKDLQEDQQ